MSEDQPASAWRAMARSLAHRNYRLFFVGQGVSLIGTWMTRVATGSLVFRLSGPDSAFLLGIVGFVGQVPSFFLTPFAGVLVDRWNRHRLFVLTQILSLIWLADHQGCQDVVMEALFRAYYTDGRDISNRQTLIDVVAEAGLERHRAEAMLNSDEGMDAIKEADELSQRHRVDGVPFFIINGKLTLGGAQPPEAFLEAFKQTIRKIEDIRLP